MTANEHPEYWHEERNLQETIQNLRREIDTIKPPPEKVYGTSNWAAVARWQQQEARVNRLKQVREKLYFGRVDWKADTQDDPETFYIGLFADPDRHIYAWQDTLPGDLFRLGECNEAGIHLLTRRFTIQRDQLLAISDEHIHPKRKQLLNLDAVAVTVSKGGDDLLVQLLEQHRTGSMHEIVATIQAEQFRLIRSPLNQVLIVQGSPGSGKTAIALHRLSYLLYPREDKSEVARSRVIFLGPNPIFPNYVARVLPELGDRNVPQMAFDEWMLRQIGLEANYEDEESALEALLDPAQPLAVRIMRYRNARHKGSISMARLLDRYVDHRIEELVNELGPLTIEFPLPSTRSLGDQQPTIEHTLEQTQLRQLIAQARIRQGQPLPINQLKAELERLLVTIMFAELQPKFRQATRGIEPNNSLRHKVVREVEQYLRPWEMLNVSVAYRALLRSSDLLQRLGEGLFDRWSLELLHLDAPKQTTPFRFSDLGALLYLAFLLDGAPPSATFDHVVIDEAQDMTPLQFEALKRWSRNQSFTIMGDLAQSIYSDHGLHDWDELEAIFDASKINRHTIQQSYRSTEQVIAYANELLLRCGVDRQKLAIPLSRSGPQPNEIAFTDAADRITQIREIIRQERSQERKSIAVLVKTAKACRQLAEEFTKAGITDFQLMDKRTTQYTGGLTLMPIYLAKGLEFDTVFIADADAESYAPLMLDVRLLYVAITRASHSLHIGWIGQKSPLLDTTLIRLEVHDFYEEKSTPLPTTIESFAQQSQTKLDADTLVERLASASKLHLLENGRIDETLLAVLADGWQPQTSEDETIAAELDPQMRQAIRAEVYTLQLQDEPTIDRAIVFLQVSYGLLRNPLASVGIRLEKQRDNDVASQAVALAQFLNAIRTVHLNYSVGQFTTENRVLQGIDLVDHDTAQELLHLLTAHGIVESSVQRQGQRIRLTHEWIERLLRSALGHDVEEWDADLRRQLPKLPHPISQQVIASGGPIAAIPQPLA